jgi:hypothetical protein
METIVRIIGDGMSNSANTTVCLDEKYLVRQQRKLQRLPKLDPKQDVNAWSSVTG